MTSEKGIDLARTKAFSRAVQIYNHIKTMPRNGRTLEEYDKAVQAVVLLIEYLKD